MQMSYYYLNVLRQKTSSNFDILSCCG